MIKLFLKIYRAAYTRAIRLLCSGALRIGYIPPCDSAIGQRMLTIYRSWDVEAPAMYQQVHDIKEWSTTWSISNATLIWLRARLEKYQPRVIVEFGSGKSTYVFARYAQSQREKGRYCEIISLEQDCKWLEHTNTSLARFGLAEYVRLCHFDLANYGQTGSYEADLDCGEVDFLFIDGPSGVAGRSQTLSVVEKHLARKCVIMLDDIARDAESRIFSEWSKRPFVKNAKTYALPHGLGCLTIG